ncbi:MAG: protein phosphatase 2C domain-containing protein [Gomphosphaeria aponina SAG 52.96 = DSM 107014]|uniref:Protein phosphatase 2C domain-containing protein n=1 Tax=Gomphosphaeria aponina SAG 52.96 = DSM 107014 TaxID=1521640 RepID=A0A941JNJ7_9CHRO|nr:protein phosphatase 2C domain-containing protein [Gomphosphaeria aponina SAG 52.96 = DSM 107014]
MGKSVAKIQCSNNNCQAFNALSSKFCSECSTPRCVRYLRGIGEGIKGYKVGELIGDRYVYQGQSVVLDTLPKQVPALSEKIPDRIITYLKLFGYRLHIPQVYGLLHEKSETWLLEYGSLPLKSSGELEYQELLPELTKVWQKATGLRQLNWLWQLARLWKPLENKGVTSSLLNASLLRVNGPIIQLLELQPDEEKPTLKQLGELWSAWKLPSSSPIGQFWEKVCELLVEDRVREPEKLVEMLEIGMEQWGQWQERTYNIISATEAGKVREHNEDACYPPPGKKVSATGGRDGLAIVCDGLGGQAGGEIASELAINSLREKLTLDSENPPANIQKLKEAIAVANDLISDRNDRENRYERERMGTTLVMTFPEQHEMYLANVGDSRIYLITSTGCHQITIDDDLASREVRLGYSLYRDVLQYPNSGALVQALGMSSADTLHTNVQRWVLDADCVFLLCSDGLSDYERVEEYWESEILPILNHKISIEQAAERLMAIANEKNGHDNITIALVHCEVKQSEAKDKKLLWSELQSSMPTISNLEPTATVQEVSQAPTQPISPPPPSSRSPWELIVISIGLLGLGIGIFYFLFPEKINSFMGGKNTVDNSPISNPPPPITPHAENEQFIRVIEMIELEIDGKTVEIPVGSILQKVVAGNPEILPAYQVCKIADNPDSELKDVEGKTGKIEKGKESEIQEKIQKAENLPKEELGECGTK